MNDETLLTTELNRRADDVLAPPLTFDAVRGRARQIRRRRAAATIAAVAVVAAIVVPVSLLAGSSGSDDDLQPAPSPTRAVDPNTGGVPTLQDGVIVYPDGPRIPLRLADHDQVFAFAPLGSDHWVLSVLTDEHGTQTVVVDETGQSVGKYPNGGGIATADDHQAVAWIDPDGSAQLLVAGTDEPRRLSVIDGADPTPAAITGDCATECDVIVRSGQQGLGASWAASTTGDVRALPADVPAVVDASLDGALLAGLDDYAADDIHVCGGVYDLRTADFLFHNCDDNVYRFSPDGGLVATTFAEGLGPTGVTIRDAHTGSPITSLTDVGWVSSFAWEDSRHLLAVVVADDGATRMERLSVDAPPEVVLDGFTTDPGGDLSPPLLVPS
jgi:hypothetical protein